MAFQIDRIYNEDCLQGMTRIPDGTVDCIISDLPYGSTACSWDVVIPFEPLWEQLKRVAKPTVPIVLFSSGLFTYKLIQSNINKFRYKLIWKKNVPTGMCSASNRPMKYYEEICVFGSADSTYNPQMKERVGVGRDCYRYNHYCGNSNHVKLGKVKKMYDPEKVQSSDVLEFDVVPNRNGKLHPTQKPVDLLRYLILTYTNPNDLILDATIGSGTTAVAALMEHRHFIGFETNEVYYHKALDRIANLRAYPSFDFEP